MYQLQLLFKNHVLIPNQHRVKSIQSRADSTVRVQDLEKFLKCWILDFFDFCGTNSSMLEAKSANDPKIKVVPYVKYYNFALVISSMQGI